VTVDSQADGMSGAAWSGMSNVYLPVIKFENDLNFTSEYFKLVLTLSFAASASTAASVSVWPTAHPQAASDSMTHPRKLPPRRLCPLRCAAHGQSMGAIRLIGDLFSICN